MPKQAAHIIAESLGWDVADVRECRYQRYAIPAVYAIDDRYFAAHAGKPRHSVGGEWREHTDQFGARGTPRRVWVCDSAVTP